MVPSTERERKATENRRWSKEEKRTSVLHFALVSITRGQVEMHKPACNDEKKKTPVTTTLPYIEPLVLDLIPG